MQTRWYSCLTVSNYRYSLWMNTVALLAMMTAYRIQDTQHTAILVSKLKSSDPNDRLIVTSIQKMSNINVQNGITQSEIDAIGRKRLVFKSHVKEARNDDAYGYVIYVPLMGQPCKAGSMGVYIYISAWGLVACSDVKGKS